MKWEVIKRRDIETTRLLHQSDGKIAASNHLVKEVFFYNKFTSGENQRIFNNQYLNFEQGTLQMV